MKKLLIKKRDGQGDLIASLFVILALTLFVFFFINTIGDVNTRIELDQIARKYILRMETSGELTEEEKAGIQSECAQIFSVREAIGGDLNKIQIKWNNDEGPKGYGSPITLEIVCPAYVTSFIDDNSNMIGSIKRNKLINYTIRKQSTAKY